MPPLETVDPVPVVNVGPPNIDVLGFFENIARSIFDFGPSLFSGAQTAFGIIVGISLPLSLFFVIVIIYCVEQLKLIRKKEALMYDTKVEPAYQEATGNTGLSHRWENVVRHIESANQNDWKQAILEADMILDDILTSMGYRGESIGEKLKRVVPGDFKTLQNAWDAHKVRNQIAHEAGFNLTQHDAQAAINNYRTVFEEFYYV